LKGQMLLDGIQADFNAPQNLAKAYRDSASYTHKVDAFLQQKPVLPILPDLDEDFPLPSPNVVAKVLAQATNFSYCAGLVKHEPCSPVSDNGSFFREFSPMKRKLNYDVNFGSFGVEDGQFSEPAGICVTTDGLIAVTDTKNHRVQVFDEIGCLKLAFGVSGSNPGQMLYPNCIASCPVTGNFVITERTPVHQVQVYSSSGRFIRRFGQNLIQFPRGVTVDKNGNIIVVECKVMRVTIFDQLGNVIRTFCAPSIMSFPMDICVNDNHEIFIVDNRRHSVHVFDYNGNNLRSMCGNGTISFPISVSINVAGELVVTDNHQSFNMTFFNQNGELIRAFESRNRHLQCLASTVHGADKIFLATKDFRVYMYDCSKGK
uniref:Brain tumor protein n=1 Tax=Panagrolaimus sp. PS1159 TaxID=55785 RepID=A0AC35G8E1_9BILA